MSSKIHCQRLLINHLTTAIEAWPLALGVPVAQPTFLCSGTILPFGAVCPMDVHGVSQALLIVQKCKLENNWRNHVGLLASNLTGSCSQNTVFIEMICAIIFQSFHNKGMRIFKIFQ